MKQPVTRERQIELMKGFEARVAGQVTKMLRVPVVRESISRDNPRRSGVADYTEETVKMANCG